MIIQISYSVVDDRFSRRSQLCILEVVSVLADIDVGIAAHLSRMSGEPMTKLCSNSSSFG